MRPAIELGGTIALRSPKGRLLPSYPPNLCQQGRAARAGRCSAMERLAARRCRRCSLSPLASSQVELIQSLPTQLPQP